MVMGKLGDTKAQVLYYQKAAELPPSDSVIWYNLGVAREKLGDNKGALDAYAKVLQIKQGDMDSLQAAAGLSLKLGQYKDAYEYLIHTSRKRHQRRNTSRAL